MGTSRSRTLPERFDSSIKDSDFKNVVKPQMGAEYIEELVTYWMYIRCWNV